MKLSILDLFFKELDEVNLLKQKKSAQSMTKPPLNLTWFNF